MGTTKKKTKTTKVYATLDIHTKGRAVRISSKPADAATDRKIREIYDYVIARNRKALDYLSKR